jgi:hypothetical protein
LLIAIPNFATMKKLTLFILLILLTLFGCHARINGTLQIDGTPFAITQCRSGQAFGFSGIELSDSNGRRLRLFASPDGTTSAALFKGASNTGDRLGNCGVLTMEAQSSRINSIVNVKGTARLDCDTGTHKVSGNVEFENCH